jgi:hypothetical protein
MTANVYTHVSMESEGEAAQAVERAIYGDLFPSREREQFNGCELRLKSNAAQLVTVK